MAYCTVDIDYAEPVEGNKRIIFALDPFDPSFEAAHCRLQLIPGRMVELARADASSAPTLGGTVEEMLLESGPTCYFVDLAEELVMTRIALHAAADEEKVRHFVPLADAPVFRYNSRFPVVVYLPEDAELRYSVWTSGGEMTAQEE
ncbi:ecotin [Strigomonas culicis]|uniref:Ecotin n=1 Tax=Strigomonas culicis TaxID=28005 RepID=S9W0R4_9TRYP|nr:ecotin [Strigomonas culicis]|eukprot:EPY29525.1 ecotin [Strigomonas culicis]